MTQLTAKSVSLVLRLWSRGGSCVWSKTHRWVTHNFGKMCICVGYMTRVSQFKSGQFWRKQPLNLTCSIQIRDRGKAAADLKMPENEADVILRHTHAHTHTRKKKKLTMSPKKQVWSQTFSMDLKLSYSSNHASKSLHIKKILRIDISSSFISSACTVVVVSETLWYHKGHRHLSGG